MLIALRLVLLAISCVSTVLRRLLEYFIYLRRLRTALSCFAILALCEVRLIPAAADQGI